MGDDPKVTEVKPETVLGARIDGLDVTMEQLAAQVLLLSLSVGCLLALTAILLWRTGKLWRISAR